MRGKYTKIRPVGYYTLTEAARLLGLSQYQLYKSVWQHEMLPKPTHKFGTMKSLFYSESDIEELRAKMVITIGPSTK